MKASRHNIPRPPRKIKRRRPLHRVHVAVPGRPYDVFVGPGLLRILPRLPVAPGLRGAVLVIADRRVADLHGKVLRAGLEACGARPRIVRLPPGERQKGWEGLHRCYRAMLAAGIDRGSIVIAFGGGVVGDLAGFAAATFLRGIGYIQIPTTLLAMVDASLGGKVGINLAEGKNLVGAFHQPRAVLADTALLRTLPPREWRSGLAEVIKYGVIADPRLLALLARAPRLGVRGREAFWAEIVRRCCTIKAGVVSRDEREAGERAHLNFGHTIGHALEALGGYRALTHGEAVSLGMVAAARLSMRRGLLPPGRVWELERLLERLGLPTRWGGIPRDPQRVVEFLWRDKKRRGEALRFVLTAGWGTVIIRKLVRDDPNLLSVIAELRSAGERQVGEQADDGPGTRR